MAESGGDTQKKKKIFPKNEKKFPANQQILPNPLV